MGDVKFKFDQKINQDNNSKIAESKNNTTQKNIGRHKEFIKIKETLNSETFIFSPIN